MIMSNKPFEITSSFSTEEEIRSDYLVSKEMKQVWACEMDLLRKLLQVCDKYGLRCWADSGTLLGAVREGGFIPWDDDIDVSMFREDYDKLVSIADKEFNHPYFFQTIYSDKHYNHRHAQLRNSETAVLPPSGKLEKYNQGIFIDIFILDAYPKSAKQAYKFIRRLQWKKNLLKVCIKFCNLLPEWLYNCWRMDIKFFKSYEELLRETPIQNTEYVSCLSWNIRAKIRLKSAYSATEYRLFEDMKIPIPAGYDSILRTDYGDYMKRVKAPTGHGILKYDTERSYKEYQHKSHIVKR
ncbi:MAG: LicD family protein [Bacteroides sp.]|nr:LicD family protein [Bacteroides sp.]